MTRAHTPGPWLVEGNWVFTRAEVDICNLSSRVAIGHEEREANARLIAAAPDLLDIVKKIRASAGALHNEPQTVRESLERADAIIAKIENREQAEVLPLGDSDKWWKKVS